MIKYIPPPLAGVVVGQKEQAAMLSEIDEPEGEKGNFAA